MKRSPLLAACAVVMHPAGRLVASFTHQSSPDAIAGKLKQLGA